jgi:cytochrome P450
MSQAYEATAGLIGNTLVALGRHAELRAGLGAEPSLLRAVVREVVRHDPPVQNTRRFIAGDGVVAGQALHEGDAVLVVLAAANRDPALNPHPDRFDPQRRDRQAYTFGFGAHVCPGEALATAIAEAGVARLLAVGVEPERLVERVTYRPSANTRIPLFGGAA